jgi:Mor family transcriptional regulator
VFTLGKRVGAEVHNAKLDDSKVRLIRDLYWNGEKMTDLAVRFGVAETTISKVVRGQRWAHVPMPDGLITTRPGSAHGSAHYHAKVNEQKVLQIRDLYRKGWTRAKIGHRFGISLGALAGIVKGRNWKHVIDPLGQVPSHHPGLPGSRHANAKLDETKVREIWSLHNAGMSAARIAPKFGVSDSTVLLILNRKAWRHVRVPLPQADTIGASKIKSG